MSINSRFFEKQQKGTILPLFIFFACLSIMFASGIYWFLHARAVSPADLQFFEIGAFHFTALRPRLLFYISTCSLLGVSLLAALFLNRENGRIRLYFFWGIAPMVGITLALACVIWRIHSMWISLLPLLILAVTLLTGLRSEERFGASVTSQKPQTEPDVPANALGNAAMGEGQSKCFVKIALMVLGAGLILGGAVATVEMYSRLLWRDPVVLLNTFQRIPEKYYWGFAPIKNKNDNKVDLSAHRSAQCSIDTTVLINTLQFHGGHRKLDILNAPDWKDDKSCVAVPANDPAIRELVDRISVENFPDDSIWRVLQRQPVFGPQLFYGEDRLCVVWAEGKKEFFHQVMTWNMRLVNEMRQIPALVVPYQNTGGVGNTAPIASTPLKALLKQAFLMAEGTQEGVARTLAANERLEQLHLLDEDSLLTDDSELMLLLLGNNEDDFISKYLADSEFELTAQTLRGGELTHQMYHFMPMFEYLNGKPLAEMTHQYGIGFTLIGAWLNKWLAQDGLFDWAQSCRLMPIVILLSYVLMAVSLTIITKDLRIVGLCAVYWVMCKLATGFGMFIVYRGLEDLRVLMYAPLLCAVYHWRRSWLVPIIVIPAFLGVALLINFEFGLMFFCAWLGVLTVLLVGGKEKFSTLLTPMLAAFTVGAMFYPVSRIGVHVVSGYYLQGLLSVPLSHSKIYLLAAMFCFYFLMYLHMRKKISSYADLMVFTIFFSMMCGLYYVWSGIVTHIRLYMFIHSIPAILYTIFILFELNKRELIRNVAFIALFLCLFPLTLNKKNYFDSGAKRYYRNVNSHILYKWDLPGTGFLSTMNPVYFSDAVELLHKFIPKEQKKVYMLSQYDFFLTYLAKKNGAYPFFSLLDFLVTEKELNHVYEILNGDVPEYLFVDSDIETPYEFDIISMSKGYSAWTRGETQFKPSTFNAMRRIFNAVKADYELVESTPIISVYKRK